MVKTYTVPAQGGEFVVKDSFSDSDLCLKDVPTTYTTTDLTECDAQFVPPAVHKRNLELKIIYDERGHSYGYEMY
jgi:hypothetical protein